MSATLDLLKELIAFPSITPRDEGCQSLIAERLKKIGFKIESMRFDEVDNLWARLGTQGPLMVFAGHTDVVPPGLISAWDSDPFLPSEKNGFLYGRGAADMKGGLAAMIVAAENFTKDHPAFSGSIAFLITSDEEGPTNKNGTKRVIQELIARNEKMDYCIVGEASSEKKVGDQIRVGRRGSLSGKLIIHGKQGHVAFPQLAMNPIHPAMAALDELASIQWDQGNEFFPATSFQISNIHAGTGAENVIPGTIEIAFNFRFSSAMTAEILQERVSDILQNHGVNFDLKWHLSGNPFLTIPGKLTQATQEAIKEIANIDTVSSTGGGTSDGRFIAATGAQVIELGPVNATIHQVNECVKISDLDLLTKMYQRILEKIF